MFLSPLKTFLSYHMIWKGRRNYWWFEIFNLLPRFNIFVQSKKYWGLKLKIYIGLYALCLFLLIKKGWNLNDCLVIKSLILCQRTYWKFVLIKQIMVELKINLKKPLIL